jgi:hypothetical protein
VTAQLDVVDLPVAADEGGDRAPVGQEQERLHQVRRRRAEHPGHFVDRPGAGVDTISSGFSRCRRGGRSPGAAIRRRRDRAPFRVRA